MSKTHMTFGVELTVNDLEDLPDDMDANDVVDELRDVLQKAANAWYAKRGHQLLACEPTL